MRSILVISAEEEIVPQIQSSFRTHCKIEKAAGMDDALAMLGKRRFDYIIIDLRLLKKTSQDTDHKEALESFRDFFPTIDIIVLTPLDLIRDAMSMIKAGASDYVTYPIEPTEIRHVVNSIRDATLLKSELDHLRDQFWKSESMELIQTQNDSMKQVYNKIRSVASTKATVLLNGETGTGKNLLAKLIHGHSTRQDTQFIEVHCGAIPETLLESELFGHEKGAFTGAIRRKLGKFEIAKDGTIFLDEIGTIPASTQVKLLQVLQDGHFSRVGGEATLQSNSRVIAATNADLKQMNEDGKFRKDLYYRLNVFPIEIPPLRSRLEDLPFLIDVFLNRLNRNYKRQISTVHPIVMNAFKAYSWPGNIRELENLMERAYILEESKTLNPESFPADLFTGDVLIAPIPIDLAETLANARQQAVDKFEQQYLKELLIRNKGKINTSAEESGVSTRQLYKLMTKYGIHKEAFKEKIE